MILCYTEKTVSIYNSDASCVKKAEAQEVFVCDLNEAWRYISGGVDYLAGLPRLAGEPRYGSTTGNGADT